MDERIQFVDVIRELEAGNAEKGAVLPAFLCLKWLKCSNLNA